MAAVRPRLLGYETALKRALAALPSSAADGPASLLLEMRHAVNVTLARTTQIRSLFDFVEKAEARVVARENALAAMSSAAAIVRAREARYRVPLERIAGWRLFNPTVYEYGYLWTVHSLQYFWRDFYQATLPKVVADVNPCLLNIESPGSVSFSQGSKVANFTALLEEFIKKVPFIGGGVAKCLEPPKSEPVYTVE